MSFHRRLALSGAFVFLAACACAPKPGGTGAQGSLPVDAAVLIAPDGGGGYSFRYSAPFADAEGNFDFRDPKIGGRAVTLTFRIEDGSVGGIKFKPEGRDAMWIVDKRQVGEGSPTGPYQGRQFSGFAVSADGRTLTVADMNNDGVVYRYALRFDLNGETVQHDPDVKNGDGGGN